MSGGTGTRFISRCVTIAGLIALGSTGANVQAATATSTTQVTTNVQATCSMVVPTLVFGSYSGSGIDVNPSLTVTCTNATSYYINIDNGMSSACCWYNRMTGPAGATLAYGLYREAAHSSCWCNTYNLDGVGGTGTGVAQLVTIYASLSAGQNSPPGAYSDTVVVTIRY